MVVVVVVVFAVVVVMCLPKILQKDKNHAQASNTVNKKTINTYEYVLPGTHFSEIL